MSSGNSNNTAGVAQAASIHQPTTSLDYVRPSAFHRDIQADHRGWRLAVDTNADANVLPNGLATIEREARQDPTPNERRFLGEDIAIDETEIARQEEVIENSQGAITKDEKAISKLKKKRTKKTARRKNEAFIWAVFVFMVLALVAGGVFVVIFYGMAAFGALLANPLAEAVQTGATNIQNLTSLFRGDAFSRAWKMGVPAFGLIMSFPAIIIGLGILLPFAKKDDPFLRRPSTLTGIALLFDTALAIGIERNLWILNEAINAEQNVFFMIMSGLSVVIFGFLSYAIFGLLFQRVADAWKARNPAHAIEQRIVIHEVAIPSLEARIREAREVIAVHRAHKRYLERILDGECKDWTFTQAKIAEFVNGWCRYIEGDGIDVEQRIERARTVQMAFLEPIKSEYGVPLYSS